MAPKIIPGFLGTWNWIKGSCCMIKTGRKQKVSDSRLARASGKYFPTAKVVEGIIQCSQISLLIKCTWLLAVLPGKERRITFCPWASLTYARFDFPDDALGKISLQSFCNLLALDQFVQIRSRYLLRVIGDRNGSLVAFQALLHFINGM